MVKFPYSKTESHPLKIAFMISHPVNVGSGAERLVYNTAKALIARGHDARIFVQNATMHKTPPFFVHPLPSLLPKEKYFERFLAIATGLNDIFSLTLLRMRLHRWAGKADVWHFHNLHGHYLSIPLLGLLTWTKPVVISPVDQYLSTGYCPYTFDCGRYLKGCGSCPHLGMPWPGISRDATHILWKMKRLFCRFSKAHLLFHTNALADHYANTFVRHRPHKVIHYGEDLNCFRPLDKSDCARFFNLKPSKRFVVGLFHSDLNDPRKGVHAIVTKLNEYVNQSSQKMDLLVVGNGSHALKDVISSELHLTALPFLRHSHELARAINLCDVLLYPTQAENLSLTCLSTLACGVPVISYNAGGQKEAIINKVNGFIVPVNDHQGMINAMNNLMQQPNLRRCLTQGARDTTEKQFDFDRYTSDLINYYREILYKTSDP